MKVKKECKWFPVCPMKYYSDAGKIDKQWTENYCHNNWGKCIRFQKEEAGIFHPDNMLPDGTIDNNLD